MWLMADQKIYTSIEQKAIGRKFGGYLKHNEGYIKLFLRCNGTNYREKAAELYKKLEQFLTAEGYTFKNGKD